jgi:hypothetical protein
MLQEPMLNLGQEGGVINPQAVVQQAMVMRATDPTLSPTPYASPADFAAQYPTPLNVQEVIAMCEEVNLLRMIPENPDGPFMLKAETWRELNELAFTSGSSYVSFADGDCPEEYTHDGDNTTVTLKNIGAKKSLSISDIMHSQAVAGMNRGGFGVGISELVGPAASSTGFPGGADSGSFTREGVANVKEKEVRLGLTLVMNGWDRLLVNGSVSGNSLEFDGIETIVTAANGSYTNSSSPSGTFSAQTYNRFLDAGCAAPTHILGHPQATNEMMSGYFTLGFNGSQQVFFTSGDRITPGINYAGFVNTSRGKMTVISDWNFDRNNSGGGTFQGDLFGLRMTHNGVPLVYRRTQIPLGLTDLLPHCTAISFMVWAKTALVVKHKCAHSRFSAVFTGTITSQCTMIG